MKKKLIISILVIIMLFPSTLIATAKPSEIPGQIKRNGPKEDIQQFLFLLYQEIAERHYLKKGWVPQGILNQLDDLGR